MKREQALFLCAFLLAFEIARGRHVLQEQRNSEVEFVGFLEPGGYVSIESLLSRLGEGSPRLEQEGEIQAKEDDLRSFENYNQLLEKSFRSKTCESILCDAIPCIGERNGDCERNWKQNPCLVPNPRGGYTHLFTWPSSTEKVRAENVPNARAPQLQKWIEIRRSDIVFKYSGTEGARQYVESLSHRFPALELGKRVRLVLSIGDAVGNLAVELGKYGVLTLSVASQIGSAEIVLERGYPALLEELGNTRLPFPDQSFDLVHCGSCPWSRKGSLLLWEADRLLQRGGYFLLFNQTRGSRAMERSMRGMCWSLFARKNGLSIWQKPLDDACYKQQQISFCEKSAHVWDTPLQPCLSGGLDQGESNTHNATRRLNSTVSTASYEADLNYWAMLTEFYLSSLGPSRMKEIRNVLDMNAGYGGFAAALGLYNPPLPWWVLNVSPVHGVDHLANVFDRGLLGVYHDWCRALNLPPRAFDLIHASRLFSSHDNNKCSMAVVMVEVDRLLRPGGFVIIREQIDTLQDISSIATAFHWKTTIVDTDSGPYGKDKLLHCQKTSWRPQRRS